MFALIIFFSFTFLVGKLEPYDVISLVSSSGCSQSSYFDSMSHSCKSCGAFQKASEDHLSCDCEIGFFPELSEKTKTIECTPCDNKTLSDVCLKTNLTCDIYDIKVLQNWDNQTSSRCLKCPYWHQPDSKQLACVPCSTKCNCPNDYEDVNGTCVRDFTAIPDPTTVFTYNLFGRPYMSNYLREWVRIVGAKCKVSGGGKHCEQLANLCVLSDYNYDSPSACTIYRLLSAGFSNNLYYDEARNSYLLNSEKVNLLKDQTLDFVVKEYSLDGSYQQIQPLAAVFESLCCASFWGPVQRNSNYHRSCVLNARNYLKSDMRFYELYMVDRAVNQSILINIPVKLENFVRGGFLRNQDNDVSRWQLTRRFFNYDVVVGSHPDGKLDFVRYLSSLTIRISVLPDGKSLGIKLPYATISYETVGNFERDKSPIIHFAVENTVNMQDSMKSLEIALSVLSAFGALYAILRIVVWYFRCDKATIDLLTLVRLIIYGADILASVILTVVFLTTFYWFITFRQQEEVTISLPGQRDEQFIKDLVISAFTLKTISVLWMIGEQCTIDMFLIDWESPKPVKGETVSVWRMYFVANEWSELQVTRKSSVSLQIILVLLALKVLDFERYALETPSTYYVSDSRPAYNTILRLALGSSTYLFITIVQNIWNAAIFERYVENKIQRFTDVCTLSNISVWLHQHARYGFYIHGRSPHGFADIDMPTMCQQLRREEENLCAQRGLVQGQETQTFTISFNQNLLDKWRKLQLPTIGNQTGANTIFTVKNQFLTTFLDHALRELDYEVRDKRFLETVLDMELWSNKQIEQTIFYNDGKNSFSSVLFYGNEITLVTLELLLFSLVDMHCHNYLAASLTVFLVFKALQFVRYRLGRRNLARKTMIDARFLF